MIFGMASEKGYLYIPPVIEGGVGGLLSWKMIFGIKQMSAIAAYIHINR